MKFNRRKSQVSRKTLDGSARRNDRRFIGDFKRCTGVEIYIYYVKFIHCINVYIYNGVCNVYKGIIGAL